MLQASKEKSIRPLRPLLQNDLARQTVPVWMQEKNLALFFVDIRDFTPLLASRSAMEVLPLLQRLFTIFRQAIHAHWGQIIETAGDGLYAVFGLEEDFEQAPSSALAAGLDILAGVAQANETYFGPRYQHHFQVGMGLHVGKVIVGQLGLGVNNQPTVMGYPVNVASRLQEATKQLNNSFLISADTFRLLENPPLAAGEWITLKGVSRPLKVYLVGHPYQPAPSPQAAWLMAG
jgi:adenylate cyclase